jgi:hypothetical protein
VLLEVAWFPQVASIFHVFSGIFHQFFTCKCRGFRGLRKNRVFFYFFSETGQSLRRSADTPLRGSRADGHDGRESPGSRAHFARVAGPGCDDVPACARMCSDMPACARVCSHAIFLGVASRAACGWIQSTLALTPTLFPEEREARRPPGSVLAGAFRLVPGGAAWDRIFFSKTHNVMNKVNGKLWCTIGGIYRLGGASGRALCRIVPLNAPLVGRWNLEESRTRTRTKEDQRMNTGKHTCIFFMAKGLNRERSAFAGKLRRTRARKSF